MTDRALQANTGPNHTKTMTQTDKLGKSKIYLALHGEMPITPRILFMVERMSEECKYECKYE
jgi:hypothetical protein